LHHLGGGGEKPLGGGLRHLIVRNIVGGGKTRSRSVGRRCLRKRVSNLARDKTVPLEGVLGATAREGRNENL